MSDERHRAFAAALEELYRRYPLPKYKYPKVMWQRAHDRDVAVRNALRGCPIYMINVFAHKVPPEEIKAVHTLIYG